MQRLFVLFTVVTMLLVLPAFASAGTSIGIFCWQLSPYTDIVCFDLESRGTSFAFDMCGRSRTDSYKTPLNGTALFDDIAGRWKLQFDWADSAFGTFFQMAADVAPGSFNGTWIDDTGDGGDFPFLGAGPLSPDFEVKGIGPKLAK
jgi:hypothetical protein